VAIRVPVGCPTCGFGWRGLLVIGRGETGAWPGLEQVWPAWQGSGASLWLINAGHDDTVSVGYYAWLGKHGS